ncbi:hypothetical protein D9M69_321580 [compost metagenome]
MSTAAPCSSTSTNIREKSVRHTNSCFFTMVAVDEQGKPCAVPARQPETADERRRFKQGKQRRTLRQELEQRYRDIREEG